MESQEITEHVMDFVTASDIPLRAVYGVRVNKQGYRSERPVISFYDRRFPMDVHGQFISDYRPLDFLDVPIEMPPSRMAFVLQGGVDAWQIDHDNVWLVATWLEDAVLNTL